MSKKIEDEKIDAKIEAGNEAVGAAIGKTELFIQKNKNKLIGILVAILAIIVAIFAYKQFYKMPRENSAMEKMAAAEHYFDIDSFAIALNGDGVNPGFVQIIDDYGSTKAGNAAHFYAGVCNLQLGNYQQAIDELKGFSAGDEILQARAYSCIGDAYANLDNAAEAASYFMKAANHKSNDYSARYLMKAGVAYEKLGKYDEALKAYKKIKTDYDKTMEYQEIDKYIERVEVELNK